MPSAQDKFLFDDFYQDVPSEIVPPPDFPEVDQSDAEDLWWTIADDESLDELLEDSN